MLKFIFFLVLQWNRIWFKFFIRWFSLLFVSVWYAEWRKIESTIFQIIMCWWHQFSIRQFMVLSIHNFSFNCISFWFWFAASLIGFLVGNNWVGLFVYFSGIFVCVFFSNWLLNQMHWSKIYWLAATTHLIRYI